MEIDLKSIVKLFKKYQAIHLKGTLITEKYRKSTENSQNTIKKLDCKIHLQIRVTFKLVDLNFKFTFEFSNGIFRIVQNC